MEKKKEPLCVLKLWKNTRAVICNKFFASDSVQKINDLYERYDIIDNPEVLV